MIDRSHCQPTILGDRHLTCDEAVSSNLGRINACFSLRSFISPFWPITRSHFNIHLLGTYCKYQGIMMHWLSKHPDRGTGKVEIYTSNFQGSNPTSGVPNNSRAGSSSSPEAHWHMPVCNWANSRLNIPRFESMIFQMQFSHVLIIYISKVLSSPPGTYNLGA